MLSISATPDWHTAYPGAMFGLLEISGVENVRTFCPTAVVEQKRLIVAG